MTLSAFFLLKLERDNIFAFRNVKFISQFKITKFTPEDQMTDHNSAIYLCIVWQKKAVRLLKINLKFLWINLLCVCVCVFFSAFSVLIIVVVKLLHFSASCGHLFDFALTSTSYMIFHIFLMLKIIKTHIYIWKKYWGQRKTRIIPIIS